MLVVCGCLLTRPANQEIWKSLIMLVVVFFYFIFLLYILLFIDNLISKCSRCCCRGENMHSLGYVPGSECTAVVTFLWADLSQRLAGLCEMTFKHIT